LLIVEDHTVTEMQNISKCDVLLLECMTN